MKLVIPLMKTVEEMSMSKLVLFEDGNAGSGARREGRIVRMRYEQLMSDEWSR